MDHRFAETSSGIGRLLKLGHYRPRWVPARRGGASPSCRIRAFGAGDDAQPGLRLAGALAFRLREVGRLVSDEARVPVGESLEQLERLGGHRAAMPADVAEQDGARRAV